MIKNSKNYREYKKDRRILNKFMISNLIKMINLILNLIKVDDLNETLFTNI